MNRVVAIFLFLCTTAPFLGTYLWLKMEKHKVKKSIKWRMIDNMDKSKLVLLKFTKEESESKLRWEHSREFEYDGEMYDVVEKEEKGDSIYYHCWWDHEETKLNKQLNELVATAMGKNPMSKDKQERLSNYLKSLYCLEKSDNNLFTQTEREISSDNIHFDYTSIFFSPSSPPPEIV